MATTVTGTLIDHPDPTNVQVSATLVDLDGHQRTGYVETLTGQIHTAIVTTPDRDGAWTLDLVANSLIESDWGDTLWRISEGDSSDYGQTASTHITVPASGGPYWVGAIRTDPPGGASPQYLGVTSVNGETGAVTLDAADVSALPLTGGTLNGSLALSGASSNLTVGGSATITGSTSVQNSLTVANTLDVGGDLNVTGDSAFSAYPTGPGTAPTTGTQLVDKTYVDGAFVPLTGDAVGGYRMAYKAADEQVDTSTAVQDDNHLTLTVAASGIYTFDGCLLFDSADANADFKLTFAGPTGATGWWAPVAITLGNADGSGSTRLTKFDLASESTVGAISGGSLALPSGYVAVGATAGSLTLRWAQASSSATPTVLRQGSWLRAHRVA